VLKQLYFKMNASMRHLKKLILVGGTTATMALTVLTGCQMFSGSDSSDRSAGRALDDKHITANVEKKLKEEPVYKFSEVDVKTFAGVVQLSGFVTSPDQKTRAGELAQRADGVSRVVNNIILKTDNALQPTSRNNQPIQSNP
jgi:hyperosmotically inducible protein